MDAINAILSRRSIRKFTNEVIQEEDLQTILKAGFAAPSAHNRQPWHFVVIKEKSTLEEIASKHPYAKMLTEAFCGIIVCGDHSVQKDIGFLNSDCSAAIENILLAAHALKLGAVWCGLYPVPHLIEMAKDVLNLPDSIIPIGLIAVGHPQEEKPPRENYDEKKVHYNKW